MWEFALLHLFANVQRGNAVLVATQNHIWQMIPFVFSLEIDRCIGDADGFSSDGSDKRHYKLDFF